MTNSSKKTVSASRDNFDLDLDARLDQATSTLKLDDEPPMGDTLDQLLARAKQEIDANLPEELTQEEMSAELDLENLDDDFNLDDLLSENAEIEKPAVKSDSMTSLENQLAAAMDLTSTLENDAELDSLLGGAGFDFDSLLGEAVSDELTVEMPVKVQTEIEPEAEVEPEPEPEAEVEPELEDDSLMSVVDELLHLGVSEKEIEAVVEPEPESAEVTENIVEPESELTVEPNAALDDLVDSVPFEDTLKVDANETENFAEEFNDFDEVADSVVPLVEISTTVESFEDDLNAMQQLDDGLNEAMENKDDNSAGFDLLDDDAAGKESATTAILESADDDWMKQLESLEESESETVIEDKDDWMKQLDDLDDTETEKTPAISLEKTETEDVIADEDDWMKQLEGLDDHDENTAKMLMDAGHDHSDDEIVDRDFNITNEPEAISIEKQEARVIDEDALIAKAADLAISQFKDEFKDDQEHVMSQLRADQDTIESRNRKQFVEAETKQKKTATFGYIALGVGVIGLLGSAGIGWLSYGTKGQTETLSQSVTALEEKVDDLLAKNPEKEIQTIKTSVEQLSQKVEKIAAAQVAVPVPAVAIAAPENGKTSPHVEPDKTHSPAALLNKVASEKVTPDVTAPKIAEAAPDEKAIETAKAAETVRKTTENAKVEAAKLAKLESEKTAKAEAQLLSEKIAKATAVAKAAASSTKTDEQRKLLTEKATRYTGRMTRGMARGIAKEKSETTKNASKAVLNTKIAAQKAVPAGKYSVNVVSYQQEWFAQSKAAEFKQKGIPVEVVPVDASKVGTRYRLKVAGFQNKAEASAYADKIKKSHNLDETWVGVN